MGVTDMVAGESMKIVRRHGSAPAERCGTNVTCPDVFELADGRFAVMGLDATAHLDHELRALRAARAAEERIVVLPREVMLAALRDIDRQELGIGK
ncbi:hypothetical protein [Asanoa iriomotensis]|uniref:Uncharacterized protein n=1 Tax=Asanoa iriomotensis TaxID=234613 RepID=A0ABQ4BVB6_9ACTN|nr:hypothetical protein [Asanoa iriomotensis]GIF54465.1 hypothetical protein Air01nite_05600 [Asanoa iriomotensis]